MDELKTLIEMVEGLPNAALWVIAAVFVYKVVVIGSIYGVIRFAIDKLHSWAVARKTREVEYKEIRPMLDSMTISGELDHLIAQIHRLRGRGCGIRSEYIHGRSIDWLREAIDDKIEKDDLATKTKAPANA